MDASRVETDRMFVEVFLYLQLMDFLTTMLGLRLGATEMSPFVRQIIIAVDPVAGVAVSKLIAVAVAAWCLWRRRARLIRCLNYWYAGVVAWNLSVLLNACR